MAWTHSWRTMGEAIAAATRQSARYRYAHVVLRTVKPGSFTILEERQINERNADRTVGIVSPDGVFTGGRVTPPSRSGAMMDTLGDEIDARGRIVHEPRASDGERLDRYLARIRPDLGDEAYWYAECEGGRVHVADKLHNGVFDRTRWYVAWAFGTVDGSVDLAPGERPRMRHGFCHIVSE